MPALVKSKFGESGRRLAEGTTACCFDWKKSRKLRRICKEVIITVAVEKEAAYAKTRPRLGNNVVGWKL
jgi:hypothetical protein